MEADFSGYATKAGLKCSDGRTITPEAFKHQDKMTVPLVWQHGHSDPNNVLGHVQLEARDDGMYCYGFFNETAAGVGAKKIVEHKDVNQLSIYANQLVEKAKTVLHGAIREVSLVLAGANPGATIDFVRVAHADGEIDVLEDEAIITTGLELEHSDNSNTEQTSEQNSTEQTSTEQNSVEHGDAKKNVQEVFDAMTENQKDIVRSMIDAATNTSNSDTTAVNVAHADITGTGTDGEVTVQDIYNSFTAEQKEIVHYMIGVALDAAKTSASHSATGNENNQEGSEMNHNVFEAQNGTGAPKGATLTHEQLTTIVEDAQKVGSFKEALLMHAVEYGIEDIDFLFPDARNVTSTPDYISRRMEWVSKVLDGAKHSPFSRIKSMAADITAEEARAKGYVKGNKKKDEIIKLLKRVTTPTTVYKKQKLDRDDIVDITDLDVVAWLKAEMRLMLDEEVARAALVGDGREPDDEDKIDEDKIRPIAYDDDMYSHSITVPANTTAEGYVEAILRARKYYKGSGTPTLFTTDDILTDLILQKDKVGRRLFNTEDELGAALRVKEIVPCEILESATDIVAIIVNMADYTFGADRGGQLGMFDDFDIDYNQYKYLLETRVSGTLTKPKSAIVLKQASGTLVVASVPTFDQETNTITVPTVTGVTYYDVTNPLDEDVLTAGDHVITETTDVEARANTGYHFAHNVDTDWVFPYEA